MFCCFLYDRGQVRLMEEKLVQLIVAEKEREEVEEFCEPGGEGIEEREQEVCICRERSARDEKQRVALSIVPQPVCQPSELGPHPNDATTL